MGVYTLKGPAQLFTKYYLIPIPRRDSDPNYDGGQQTTTPIHAQLQLYNPLCSCSGWWLAGGSFKVSCIVFGLYSNSIRGLCDVQQLPWDTPSCTAAATTGISYYVI